MADLVYPSILEALATKQVSFTADTVKLLLVSAGYTFSAAHQYISDIGGGNIVARSGALASKSATGGVLDATDVTFTALTGSVVTQLILAFDTGVDSTSRLIAKCDSYAGLPYTPTGADLPVLFPNDANKFMTV